MDIQGFTMAAGNLLGDHYIHDFDKVSDRFDYDWRCADSWALRAEWLDAHRGLQSDRESLVDVLTRFNSGHGAGTATLTHIEQLRGKDALVVTGGQQSGLFGGPQLVIYKVVTIIRSAQEAQRRLGRPVIPVFWIAGEDHDLDEVNHIYVPGEGRPERIRLELQGEQRLPVSERLVSQEEWESVLQALLASFTKTEFTEALSATLRQFVQQSRTLSDFFAKMLLWLFADRGLVVLDSHDPNLRQIERPMFHWLADHAEAYNAHLLRAKQDLEQRGYHVQATVNEHAANLFVVEDAQRVLLYRDQASFIDRKGTINWSPEQLHARIEDYPETMSNNVLTRPLMQDYVLPVLAAVLGPGELAYWSELKEAFHYAERTLPILLPRERYTLLEGHAQRGMKRFGLSVDEALMNLGQRRSAWLTQQDQLGLDVRFADACQQFESLYEPLVSTVSTINPGMKQLAATNRDKILEQIAFLHKKAKDAQDSQHATGLRQWDRLAQSLLPMDKPQERVYNVFGYLNQYGRAWLDALLVSEKESDHNHYIVWL